MRFRDCKNRKKSIAKDASSRFRYYMADLVPEPGSIKPFMRTERTLSNSTPELDSY